MIAQVRSIRTWPTTAFVVASVLVVGFLAAIPTASAAAFTGGFSPTIIGGGADLNGDGVVTGRDDSNAFFGDTSIIDGKLDCDTWGATQNAGSAGDGAIDTADDCTLVGYNGTASGVTITVTDGVFGWPSGTALPTVYNAAVPANPDVSASDFAWSTIDGKVDSNGDEFISSTDCAFGLIGQTVDIGFGDPTDGADILGSDVGCGFASGPPSSTLNGLVDLNSDVTITAADSCTNGCFFGHNVTSGLVQSAVAMPTITSFTPTAGPVGTSVTIKGTNLTGATSVKFNGVSATITSNTATQIVTKVPTGATTGKITVTTAGGTATSATNFTVTALHARNISLRLRDSLVARGKVTVSDGFTACADTVQVKVQRRVSGHWKTVKSTTTSTTGGYRARLPNRHGRYRSLAPQVTKGMDTCGRAVSPTQRH